MCLSYMINLILRASCLLDMGMEGDVKVAKLHRERGWLYDENTYMIH